MRLLIMGPQGVGKGTQAALLAEHFNIPTISTGDIFRYNIKNKTELGLEAMSYTDKGELVPDSLTNKIVKDRLAMDDAKNSGHALHVMGLLSTGGVHSHLHHIFAALDMAKQRGVEKVYVHCFLDGRDVPPKSGAGFVKELQEKCDELGNAKLATLQGRFWGMDRDKRWDRVEAGYNAIVCGEGAMNPDPVKAVEGSYEANVSGEFVKAGVV